MMSKLGQADAWGLHAPGRTGRGWRAIAIEGKPQLCLRSSPRQGISLRGRITYTVSAVSRCWPTAPSWLRGLTGYGVRGIPLYLASAGYSQTLELGEKRLTPEQDDRHDEDYRSDDEQADSLARGHRKLHV